MPAIVVLGAQWGDEGKGKATDLLATSETIDFVVRTSGGHNAGHTDRHQRREVRHPPAPQRHPHARRHERDRQRRRRLARGAVPRARRPARARGRDGRPGGQRQRARHRVVPLHDRQGHRALPRQEPDRHHRSRHRPGLRRQDQPRRRPGRGPLRRGHPAQKVEAALDVRNHLLTKVYNRRAIEVDAVVEELLSYAERLRPMVADTSLLLNRALDDGQDGALRGRPGDHARRRPRHLPVRHVVQRRSPAASAPAPASAPPASTG